jgi:hypothetical protein
VPAPADLIELQRFLTGALRREVAIPDEPAVAEETRAHVTGNDRLTPAEQADLYRQQFWLRHVACLTEDYPALRRLLGEEAFEAFTHAYLTAHPPRTPSLRDLGADFVSFAERWDGFPALLAHAGVSAAEQAERRAMALELVRYEHSFVGLFDGGAPPTLEASKLTALGADAWERARVVLSPLLARHRLTHAMHLYRLATTGDDLQPPQEAGGARPRLPDRRAVSLVLYRRDLVIRYDEIEPFALDLLDALAAGEPLGPACERVAAQLPPAEAEAFAAKLGGWFQDWTAKGWIVDVVA